MKNKSPENSNENGKAYKKRKLTKRGLLYIVNAIAFVIFLAFSCRIAQLEFEFARWIFIFLLVQCVFTFLSLIVYYLSIMADALNKRYVEKEKEEKEAEQI